MEAIGLAGLIAIIYKVVDFLKYVSARDINAIVTQASVWLSALAVALLAREADPFAAVGIMGTTFENLDLAATVLFALGIGSTASGVMDFKKAIDSSDSAKTPPLLPTSTPDTRPVEVA
jgi:hypothetical protein